MRTVSIDIDNLKEVYECGHCGEHNATKLNINVASLCSGASFLVAVFKNGFSETFCSERFYTIENNAIEVPLWQALTKTGIEYMVVEAYTKDENDELTLLAKSPKVQLSFEGSIKSDDAMMDDETHGLYKELCELEERFNTGVDTVEGKLDELESALERAENVHDGADGAPGPQGPTGADGYSPSVTAERNQSDSGAVITVTDKKGTNQVNINDGTDGKDGATGPQGPTGADGYSPSVTVERNQSDTGAVITVTDKKGTTQVNINDGSVTDKSLTIPNVAADAKSVGEILGTVCFSIGDASFWEQKNIYDGKKVDAINKISLVDYLPENITHITIDSGYSSLIYAYTDVGEYVGYWTGSTFAKNGTPVYQTDFDIPSGNYKYLLNLKKNDDANIATTAAIAVHSNADNSSYGIIQEIDEVKKSVPQNGENLTVNTGWTLSSVIRIFDNQTTGAKTGDLVSGGVNVRASDYIYCKGSEMLEIIMPRTTETTPPQFGLCFYDKDKNALVNSCVSYYYNRQSSDEHAQMAYVYVPQNAAYFRTTYWTEAYIQANCPNLPFVYSLRKMTESEKPITHELPTNDVMMNVVRRARQMTDVKWQPLVDVPRYNNYNGDYSGASTSHFLDWFKAKSNYMGVPYSGSGDGDVYYGHINPNSDAGKWGYYMMFVGLDIDLETFITAARYPNSIFGERTGLTEPNYYSSPYGLVCNAFVHYCFGRQMPVAQLNSYVNNSNFKKVADSIPNIDTSVIRLCDVLHWGSFHIAIITDIARNADGAVTGIEVAEATTAGNGNNAIEAGLSKLSGVCRRKMFTVDEFKSWFRNYKLYRWVSFTDIPYTKSVYVDTGNEGDYEKIVDLPCIPYLGNKARYKVGYIRNTKILIGATGFTTLVVMKDGSQFGTFPINGQTEIETGFSEAGNYSAYLVDVNNNKSMSCVWSVIPMDYS